MAVHLVAAPCPSNVISGFKYQEHEPYSRTDVSEVGNPAVGSWSNVYECGVPGFPIFAELKRADEGRVATACEGTANGNGVNAVVRTDARCLGAKTWVNHAGRLNGEGTPPVLSAGGH